MQLNIDKTIDSLTLSSMKSNYPEFVSDRGYDAANVAMGNVYGDVWLTHQHEVWQWFDDEGSSHE